MPSPVNSVHQLPAQHHTTHSSATEQTQAHEQRKTVLETHGYYLGKTIGAGSYANVRMAHSELHGGNVAIKIVSKYTAPEDYLKKFLPREIEVVKGLKHPNLIRFLQAIETTHRVYIVMEFAENGSLLDIIRRDSYIDEIRARKWFRQLVEAIEYCHERGVVHRDIKCENLLMDADYNIKVSDFGFARSYVKSPIGHQVLSETFCGSYAYASPEILRGIPYQPQQSDIWSMGVVLYAMVYGRLPFDDANYNLLLKQVTNKVTFPRDPKVTMACRTLITKILAQLKTRIRISGIKQDPWYTQSADAVHPASHTAAQHSQVAQAAAAVAQQQQTAGAEKILAVAATSHDPSDDTDVSMTATTTRRLDDAAPTSGTAATSSGGTAAAAAPPPALAATSKATADGNVLLTKQHLKDEASKKSKKRRYSTDEETPLATLTAEKSHGHGQVLATQQQDDDKKKK